MSRRRRMNAAASRPAIVRARARRRRAQKELQATAGFGADEDGLKRPWKGSVHVFPPLDRVPAFVLKVLDELDAGRVTRGALLAPFDLTDSLAGPCPRSRSSPRGRDRERPTTIPIRRHHGQRTGWRCTSSASTSPLPACSPSSASGGTSCRQRVHRSADHGVDFVAVAAGWSARPDAETVPAWRRDRLGPRCHVLRAMDTGSVPLSPYGCPMRFAVPISTPARRGPGCADHR